MKKNYLIPLFAMVLIALPSSVTRAADQARIQGTVRDASGAIIPGAAVTARQKETGFSRSATSDDEGYFILHSLPTGTYDVTAENRGFAGQTQAGIQLVLGQQLTLPFVLQIAAVSSSVEVQASTLEVSLNQSQIGGNVTPQVVTSMPLDGRNFVDLASLVPGVTVAGSGPTSSGIPVSGGQQLRSKNLVMDGASEKEDYGGGFRGNYSLEAVREFQVITNRFSPEFGRSSGGIINVITKSGTNDLHGSLYGFFRTDNLDARNPVAVRKPPFHRYQYGASAGGPLVKDRTHFFGSYERQDLDSPRIVVTPVFKDNVPGPRQGNLALVKIDHQYLSSQRLSVRYNLGNSDEKNLFVGETVLPSAGVSSKNHTQSVVANNLYSISPTRLNETTVQFARSSRIYTPNDPVGPMLMRPSWISGRMAIAALTSRREDRVQVVDNFSWFRGKHSVKFGADINFVKVDGTTDYNFGGTYMWVSDVPSAPPFSYTQNMGDPRVVVDNSVLAFYFLDDWRVNKRLTFNLGVRWDGETNAGGSSHDWNNFAPRVGFAWDFLGDGKGAIRGGFGMFYDQVSLIATNDAELYNGSRITGIRISNPNYPDPFSGKTPVPVIPQKRLLDPDLRAPYSHQSSIGLEREIADRWVLMADYVFVRGAGLLRTRNLNPLVGGKRPNPAFADIRNVENSGNSFYHGLLMGVRKPMNRYFEVMASYTLSRAQDENQDYNTLPQNNFNLRSDRGYNLTNARHNFVANALVRLPGGFDFSTITAVRSGTRYNITTGKDDNGDGNVYDRPSGYPRNSGIGPGFVTVNVRLNKRLKVGERCSLEGILETFNLFNRANYAPPEGNMSSTNYGRSLSASDPRQLQLAFRFNF